MKADRLLSIMLCLQNEGKMTTKELADRLEVSDRTICRDMEALSAAGIPVYADRGPLGGWALSDGYRTRLTGMTQQELLALLLAKPSGALGDLGIGGDFETAFRKLLAASPESLREYAGQLRDRIHIDGTAWYSPLDKTPYLSIVKQAVWSCRKLAIEYPVSANGRAGGFRFGAGAGQDAIANAFEAVAQPLGLVAKRSIWYMVARIDEEVSFFRVSRLLQARMLAEPFERPAGFDLAAYWEQATERYIAGGWNSRVRLRLREDTLPYLPPEKRARMLSSRRLPDGWLEAELEFRSPESARKAVFALGPNAEVLEPAELRGELLAAARAIVAIYSGRPAAATP